LGKSLIAAQEFPPVKFNWELCSVMAPEANWTWMGAGLEEALGVG
jgi:hypothetical protein